MIEYPSAEVNDAVWARALDAVQSYVRVHGTADIPPRARAEGFDIGHWVRSRRAEYHRGLLPPGRISTLEALPGWTWYPRRASRGSAARPTPLVTATRKQRMDSVWKSGLRALAAWVTQHGTANPPRTAVINSFPLGRWVVRQREAHRAGLLPNSQASELQRIPGWNWDPREQSWHDGLARLRAYTAAHGSATPPQHLILDGFPLGRWTADRRRQHRLGTLPPDWITAMEALPGWSWHPNATKWEAGLRSLSIYAARNGAATPPQSATLDGYPVGQWVHHQRVAYRTARLSNDRIAALEALPGWIWNPGTKNHRSQPDGD